ncbi:class I SAM-dependent methyltransferase [Patescibacteria group bacterium]|nr:class I SAM-dependent methyltransferase [Patescibacteria group bacterium]
MLFGSIEAVANSIPIRIGYADAQHIVDITNAHYLICIADDKYAEEMSLARLRSRISTSNFREKQIVAPFLKWVSEIYNPQLVYYPFSGWHITPRMVFGEDKVVHLSNDDHNPFTTTMGLGLIIKGDAYSDPFEENSFDAILFNQFDPTKKKFFPSFRRVVKEGGLFIIDQRQKNIINWCRANLQPVDIPKKIKNVTRDSFALFSNQDRIKQRFLLFWYR